MQRPIGTKFDISSEVQQIGGELLVRKKKKKGGKKLGFRALSARSIGLIEIHTRHYRRFADGNRARYRAIASSCRLMPPSYTRFTGITRYFANSAS